jgi:hypothetical protein
MALPLPIARGLTNDSVDGVAGTGRVDGDRECNVTVTDGLPPTGDVDDTIGGGGVPAGRLGAGREGDAATFDAAEGTPGGARFGGGNDVVSIVVIATVGIVSAERGVNLTCRSLTPPNASKVAAAGTLTLMDDTADDCLAGGGGKERDDGIVLASATVVATRALPPIPLVVLVELPLLITTTCNMDKDTRFKQRLI